MTVGRVGRRDGASPHEPLPERLEIAVGRDLPVPLGAGARRRHVSFDPQTEISDRRRERQRADGAGRAHARGCANALEQALVEADDLLGCPVRRLRQRQPHGEHVRGIEPEIDALQRPEGAEHQPRAGEQHDGERHLDDHEPVAEALAGAAARAALAAVLQRIGQIDAHRAQRGGKTEDDAGQERDDRREREDAAARARRPTRAGCSRGSTRRESARRRTRARGRARR